MPHYQNQTVSSSKLIIGNYKIEVALSAGGSFVNLGAGMVNSFGHVIENYEVQAGNAPDPLEGISKETFTIEAELIEYDASVLTVIQGGAIICTTTSGLSTINGGGAAVIEPRVFRLTNTRMVSGATKETVVTVYKATCTQGIQFTAKSDNDADPINVMPLSIVGKPDGARSVGSQLFTITRSLWS